MMEVWEEREERRERRTAKICAVLANCHRDKKKRARPYTEDDFMPRKKLTPEQIEKKIKAIFGWQEQQ